MRVPAFRTEYSSGRYLPLAAVAVAVGIGWLAAQLGPLVPGVLVAVMVVAFSSVAIFLRPRIGVIAYVVYCFVLGYVARHLTVQFPMGLGMDILLVMTWLAVFFNRLAQLSWKWLRQDICWLALGWFGITLLEIVNPAGASLVGWFYEMRSVALYWLLTVPLCFLVFNQPRDLRLFLLLIIGLSALGAVYGIKQKIGGVDAMEQQWLDRGAAGTHLIWGQLRVFSFYTEAAQFGASQAHIGLICAILALGPFVWWKRALLGGTSLLLFYGMLISGTRGAMFVLATGLFIYLLLSKRTGILVLGCLFALASFCVLKYTSIGSSNMDIVRLRTSLNPQDPSFQLRLANQAKLRSYLADRPFGEGVGTIGVWGHQFNADKYISTIEPDSYYIKVWAEYGIVGFIIWFGMMLFILGKCCGIVWNIQNPQLRQKLLALTAGYGGILVSSYGNEVMNQIPSAMIIYLSWAFIFLGPSFDQATPSASLTDG